MPNRAYYILGTSCSNTSEDFQEEAIKFFKRAIQLDPNLVYAYSLIGHELVSMEKYEKVPSAQRYSLHAVDDLTIWPICSMQQLECSLHRRTLNPDNNYTSSCIFLIHTSVHASNNDVIHGTWLDFLMPPANEYGHGWNSGNFTVDELLVYC